MYEKENELENWFSIWLGQATKSKVRDDLGVTQ